MFIRTTLIGVATFAAADLAAAGATETLGMATIFKDAPLIGFLMWFAMWLMPRLFSTLRDELKAEREQHAKDRDVFRCHAAPPVLQEVQAPIPSSASSIGVLLIAASLVFSSPASGQDAQAFPASSQAVAVVIQRASLNTAIPFPAANTNAARGTALRAACGAAQSGDTIKLQSATYDVGSTALVFPAGVTVQGVDRFSTRLQTELTTAIDGTRCCFEILDGTILQDVELYAQVNVGTANAYQLVVGPGPSLSGNMTAHLHRVKITGNSDGIYYGQAGQNATVNIFVRDSEVSTTYDTVAMVSGGTQAGWNFTAWNTTFTTVGPFNGTPNTYNNCVNNECGTVVLENCQLNSSSTQAAAVATAVILGSGSADSTTSITCSVKMRHCDCTVSSTGGSGAVAADIYFCSTNATANVGAGHGSGNSGGTYGPQGNYLVVSAAAGKIFYDAALPLLQLTTAGPTLQNPLLKVLTLSNAGSGDTQFKFNGSNYTPPTGRKALLLRTNIFNAQGSGAINAWIEGKIVTTQYPLTTTQNLAVGGSAVGSPGWIFTGILSLHTDGAGCNAWATIIEFDSATPIKTVTVHSATLTANTYGTLYTCPTTCNGAILLDQNYQPLSAGGNIWTSNNNATAKNVYAAVVPSGQTVGAGYQATPGASAGTALNVPQNNVGVMACPAILAPGDTVQVVIDNVTSNSYLFWVNVLEF